MEQVTQVEITVTIETNKGTYTRTFSNMDDAVSFYDQTMEDL